jgi:hypothetical protein
LLDHGKDIVGATYVQRNAPHALLGVKVTGAPLGIKRPPEGKTWSGPPLIEALCLPTGCLLIKMNVFSKLRRPYFHLRVDEGLGVEIGEDIVFCEKARKEGFQVWCDPALSLELGHVGQSVFFIP